MDPGSIRLDLGWAQGRIVALTIVHHQPQAARLLRGLPVAEAVARLPRLFSLCSRAQGAAARSAQLAATGQASEGDDAAVAAEAAQEHLWRLLIDWPRELGLAQQQRDFARWRRELLRDAQSINAAGLVAYLEQEFFGMALSPWLCLSEPEQLRHWSEHQRTPGARLCAALLRSEDAGAPPSAENELGALRRRRGDGLLAQLPPLAARVVARMRELAAQVLRDQSRPLPGMVVASPLGEGRGRSSVETARGSLVHELEIAAGKVASYTIVTPTEVNFAAQGPLHSLLLGRACASAEAALSLARRCALALDPCVACSVKLA